MNNPLPLIAETDSPTLLPLESKLRTGEYIKRCQREDGAILWFDGDKLDPWDHTEAAMGLSICGELAAAKHAFIWLEQQQNSNGSWYAKYYGDENDGDSDRTKVETNFVAYPATGLWHYYLISKDKQFVDSMFPCIEKAIDYVISQQTVEGDIQWATSTQEQLPNDALITACASILRSIESALHLAALVKTDKPDWQRAYHALAEALKNKPWRFDRTWPSKSRFSMDWFYPVLSGIYTHDEASLRLDQRWQEFVHPDFGCRCVNDEPWVTIAESCELTLALLASGQEHKARTLFQQLLQWQDSDGGFWTGYSFRDKVIWPHEKTSWTAAAILLAGDALEKHTPAADLFIQPSQFFTQ